jgi:hypothetical protein
MDPPSSNAVTASTYLLPEQLTEILLSNQTIKQQILNQRESFNLVQYHLQKAKESKDDFDEETQSLFSSISALINCSFPVLQEFTSEHETAVRDFIYFEVFGWSPTNHLYWVHKRGTLIRAHPRAFQTEYKKVGGQISSIVKQLKIRHNNKVNKQIRNKSGEIMPANNQQMNEQKNDEFKEEKIDYNINIMQMDQSIGSNIGSIIQVKVFNFLFQKQQNKTFLQTVINVSFFLFRSSLVLRTCTM